MQKYNYDVLGIGNAVTDIFVEVEESFLKKNNLVEGTMKLVDEVFIMELLKDLNISKTYAGGSVANTLSTISKLGGKCPFIGSRKNDKYGNLFSNSMEQEKIDLLNKENAEGKASSLCLVLVTPNGERTMCTYLGASTNLNNDNLELSSLTKSNIIYLEGYLFDRPDSQAAFIRAVELCNGSGGQSSLSLSDPFCVERHREAFQDLIANHINMLFCNEHELLSMYGGESLNDAIEIGAQFVDTLVCTAGAEGAYIANGGEIIHVPANSVNMVDATGAGDLFAAGFLAGVSQNKSLEVCGMMGCIAAAEVISSMGARPQTNLQELFDINKL